MTHGRGDHHSLLHEQILGLLSVLPCLKQSCERYSIFAIAADVLFDRTDVDIISPATNVLRPV